MCHNPLLRVTCEIISNNSIATDIYDMTIKAPDVTSLAVPGQFVNLYCGDGGKLLPRPISICNIDKAKGTLRLVYALVGEGTKDFALMKTGDPIDVLGPLGKGFSLEVEKKQEILIVGGGVGTPPLLELSKVLYDKGASINVVLGFRDIPYLYEEFKKYANVYVATDSGHYGFKGNVIQLIQESDELREVVKNAYVYACGPTPMLKALQAFMDTNTMTGEFSLEERMGCGFGGCVGCVVPIQTDEGLSKLMNQDEMKDADFVYKKVCKDGPIFNYREVIFR